jgi:hypothetical protein
LIDFGVDYFEFWSYIEVSFLTEEGISLFVDKLRFDDLTLELWSKDVTRLKATSDEKLHCQRKAIPYQSTILSRFLVILSEFRAKKWTLLYRATEDGFGSANFHRKRDHHSNTITLVSTTTGFPSVVSLHFLGIRLAPINLTTRTGFSLQSQESTR